MPKKGWGKPKKISVQKYFAPKQFWVQRSFWLEKMLGPKKILGRDKKSGVQENLVKKSDGSKNMLGKKVLGATKFWAQKGKKKLGSK